MVAQRHSYGIGGIKEPYILLKLKRVLQYLPNLLFSSSAAAGDRLFDLARGILYSFKAIHHSRSDCHPLRSAQF